MCYSFVFKFLFTIKMEHFLLFLKNQSETNTKGSFCTNFRTKWNICFCSKKNWNETKATGIDINNTGTKWNVYFHSSKKLERNQKLKEFLIPILEWNGMFAFIRESKQIQTKRICMNNFGTKWNVYFYSSENWNKTKAKEIFCPNLRAKWNISFGLNYIPESKFIRS
jgi:leucyl aminopeptidase (aminopeptidase T)